MPLAPKPSELEELPLFAASAAKVEAYAEQYPEANVKLLQQANAGEPAARNTGNRAATATARGGGARPEPGGRVSAVRTATARRLGRRRQ